MMIETMASPLKRHAVRRTAFLSASAHDRLREWSLPTSREALGFLEALHGAVSDGTPRTWASHVNRAIMAGGGPGRTVAPDLVGASFDTFTDHLFDVLRELGALAVGTPKVPFSGWMITRNVPHPVGEGAWEASEAGCPGRWASGNRGTGGCCWSWGGRSLPCGLARTALEQALARTRAAYGLGRSMDGAA